VYGPQTDGLAGLEAYKFEKEVMKRLCLLQYKVMQAKKRPEATTEGIAAPLEKLLVRQPGCSLEKTWVNYPSRCKRSVFENQGTSGRALAVSAVEHSKKGNLVAVWCASFWGSGAKSPAMSEAAAW